MPQDMNFSEIDPLIYLIGTLTCKGDICRLCCPSFGVYPSKYYFRAVYRNANDCYDSQTAKAVRADQDALSEMFERIEVFFRRLDMYTEVAPNQGMVNIITAIMVVILDVIGIVTKEIKQCRTSKSLFYK